MSPQPNIFGTLPQFEHDCDHCTFIARIEYEGKPADMFVHLRVHANAPEDVDTYDLNTVVRFSDSPEDYTSWTQSTVPYTESWPIPEITDPFGDEASFEPMAEWEMELLGEWPVSTITTPLPVSGDLIAKIKRRERFDANIERREHQQQRREG